MNPLSIHPRLYWKECRQLLPAILLLTLLFAALQLILTFIGYSSFDPHWYSWIGIPYIYALAIPLLVVGQERETRSLTWLSSLPILPKQIYWTKWIVIHVGLVVVWSLAYFVYQFFHYWNSSPELPTLEGGFTLEDRFHIEILLFLASLYLLQFSLAVAWKVRSPLNSLWLIAVGAALPWLLYASLGSFEIPNATLYMNVDLFCVIAAIVAFGIQLRFARFACRATPAPSASRSFETMRNMVYKSPSAMPTRLYSESSALIWQGMKRNRIFLIGSVVVAGVSTYLNLNQSTFASQWAIASNFALAFMISSLGLLAFHGERGQGPSRFLIERGVSLHQLWWTRHVLPLAILAIFLGMMETVLWVKADSYFSFNSNSTDLLDIEFDWVVIPRMYVFLTCIMAFSIYSISQWLGQIIKPTSIAILAIPIVLAAYSAFVAYLVTTFRIHVLLLLCLPIAGFVATRLLMRPWGDNRTGIRFYLLHTGLFILGLAIPLLPPAVDRLRVESLERSVTRRSSIYLKNIPIPSSVPQYNFIDYLIKLRWTRYQLESKFESLSDPSTQPDDELRNSIAEYQTIFVDWNQAIDLMRESESYSTQEFATQEEGLQWEALQRQGVKQALGKEIVKQQLTRLANSEFRRGRHLQTAAIAWRKWVTRDGGNRDFELGLASYSEGTEWWYQMATRRDAAQYYKRHFRLFRGQTRASSISVSIL